MFRCKTMFLLTLLSAVALPGAPIRAATPDGCAAAPAFSTPDEKLKHLAEAVQYRLLDRKF